MGTYNSAVITTAGQSLLARAIADSLPFYMTSAKTTEYVVPTGTSAASLTELPNVKQSEDITSATVSGGNQVATSVRFDNTEITLNYSINTIGVYARVGTDTEETLLAVITAITADVMPSYSAANPVSYVYSINLAISNASNINIVVSPTGTVTVAEFTELKERVDEIIDSGSGLSADAKMALLNCFEHVAWIDEHGQTYYDTLHDALFPSAVSISATFTPGSHVFYETDSLDALRPYLIVRATMPDGSVDIVTNYTLSGSMAVGTNTITVRYQGLTDTFEVTTQANPAYITAVYTQTGIVWSDDTLDSLKSDLVVTYYSAPGATGTVLSDSDYTLFGTLTAGNCTITATYEGKIATFNVECTQYFDHVTIDGVSYDISLSGHSPYKFIIELGNNLLYLYYSSHPFYMRHVFSGETPADNMYVVNIYKDAYRGVESGTEFESQGFIGLIQLDTPGRGDEMIVDAGEAGRESTSRSISQIKWSFNDICLYDNGYTDTVLYHAD